MVRVGIVDDAAADRRRLHEALSRFEGQSSVELEVHEFESAGAYLAAQDKAFDILYLDIDMPGMSGMELAQSIRLSDSGVVIIFCTNLQQFAVNGYTVGALGFIVKPVEWYTFELFLRRALQAVELRCRSKASPPKRIVLKDGAVSRVIDVGDLEFVEVRKHYLLYRVRSRGSDAVTTLRTRGTMQAAARELSPYGFSRCSASYLVNLSHVSMVEHMSVHVGDEVLPIGRTYRDEFKRDFSRHLATRDWEGPCQ